MASKNDDIAIKVDHVSKTFKLPHEKTTSVKNALINLARHKRGYEKQCVLKDVSFEVKKGEFFGIVGRNGSGKSTLLKLLAGIYTPDSGSIQVNGKLTPFIELGVGFNPELTGRENVFMNGALLGFSRKEVQAMYDDIVEFAELGRFMDQKLKNYSSGMQVRLAFSIATRAQSDILVLDEVLAVGDMDFQQKCFDYFITLKQQRRTVILVTHDMGSVLKFCDKALLIDGGNIQSIAQPKEIADAYVEVNYEKQRSHTAEREVVQAERTRDGAYVTEVKIVQHGKPRKAFESGEICEISIGFVNPKKESIHFGLQIFNRENVYCFGTNSKIANIEPVTDQAGSIRITLTLNLAPGQYTITGATMSGDGIRVYDYQPNAAAFRIKKTIDIEGVAVLTEVWEK